MMRFLFSAAERPRPWLSVVFLMLVLFAGGVSAQAPAAGGSGTTALSQAQLDKLVGPIALYPDDLVGIILPAATYPLEIVQADRFLEQRKSDKNLPVDEAWHDPVKSLLNYPDVVKKMSADLDWTSDLGEAVVSDQGAVLGAIQRFRRQAQTAGNLKSDDKQTVIVEKEVIQVVQANPEVIYVPQYNPATVVVAGAYPAYGYYPAPYPVYYYPYPPGAAFATGLIWGAAITAAWNGGHYATHYGYGGGNNNINVNRNVNVNTGNINTGNVNVAKGNRAAQTTAWQPDKKPGQVSGSAGRQGGAARVGDAPRAASSDLNRGARQPTASQASARPTAASSERATPAAQNRGGDAFGGYGSGRDARADSSRGAASREAISTSTGRGQSFQGGGGGRSASAGGGRSAPSGGGRVRR